MRSQNYFIACCIKLFFIFTFHHCFGNEHFYSCLDEKIHTCPLDFFVLEIEQERNIAPGETVINELLNIYQDGSSLYSKNCWKIENEYCLLELQKCYELYNLELLPFPLSRTYRYSNDKLLIHIQLNGDTNSNAIKNACDHLIVIFALTLSIKITTDSIVWPVLGVALYTGFFATFPKAYNWLSEKRRKYF